MSRPAELHAAYVLHTRKYRDTSLLVEVFSRDEGRYTLVAKGARSKKPRFHLQLFSPVLVSSVGRGELKTATEVEANGPGYLLAGRNLMIGMYVNELLYRLVGKYDPTPHLFDRYSQLLSLLQSEPFDTGYLRAFEISLLAELGYGISFDVESTTGDTIMDDGRYCYFVEDGFHYAGENQSARTIEGRHLRAIAEGRIDADADRVARGIVRQSVDQILGGKPLHSRRLFA
ncbi:MAG TPA: DNA repair protein RecO [Gammaproteobacteria bacterium]|nr:DNA repair protein RecO [Gammaproteobacteria bacterium]